MQKHEFVINRYEDGYPNFDLPYDQWRDVLRPNTLPVSILEESQTGNHVIEVDGHRIRFIDEMFGLQVIIESEEMPYKLALRLVQEICTNVELATGNIYEIHEMPADRPYQF
jgi:hypothetical protein